MSYHLPTLTDQSLSRYIQQVSRFPMLSEQEEQQLANRWRNEKDVQAAHHLVTSHLRLVVKIAMGFKGYGLAMNDMIAEGNVGLMQAVKKFNPDNGNRLSTYAMWWIKASIHEFVLRSWSLVKIGTTSGQKKLFYNLKRLKKRILGAEEEDRALLPQEAKNIANDLHVSQQEVLEMDSRMYSTDLSLNRKVSDEEANEFGDFLADESDSHELILAEQNEMQWRKTKFHEALKTLNAREQDIVNKRKLQDPPATLETLSEVYQVSKERIRQIEVRALEKLQHYLLVSTTETA